MNRADKTRRSSSHSETDTRQVHQQSEDKHARLLIATYFFSLIIIYLPLTIFVVTPVGDGWTPFPVCFSGSIPYKDTYYPSLPGLIWLCRGLDVLPGNILLLWHIVGLLGVLSVAYSTLLIIPKQLRLSTRLLASAVATSTFIAFTEEHSSGWNHISLALSWLAVALIVQATRREPIDRSIANANALLAGVLAVTAVFVKHTALLPLGIAWSLGWLGTTYDNRNSSKQKLWAISRWCLSQDQLLDFI
jgi:hypothetical protein